MDPPQREVAENQPHSGLNNFLELLAMARENPQLLEMLKANPQFREVLGRIPRLDQMLQDSDKGENISKPNEQITNCPVHFAALRGNVDELRKKIHQEILKSDLKIHPHLARGKGRRGMFFDINLLNESEGVSALHFASYCGHMAACHLLLENGADVNLECRKGFTPADYAHQEKKFEVAEFLVSRGGVYKKRQRAKYPIHCAAFEGNLTEVQREILMAMVRSILGIQAALLNNIRGNGGEDARGNGEGSNDAHTFFNIDGRKENNGRSPLMDASQNGHVRVCKLLIDNGANLNLQDNTENMA